MSITLEQEAGALYAQLDGERCPVRAIALMIPKPGDQICQLADGSTHVASAGEIPQDTVTSTPIEDHLVTVFLDMASDRVGVAYLDVTREAARRLLLFAYPNAVIPTRRLSRAERKRALSLPLGAQAFGTCADAGCQRPATDACSCCEALMCPQHATLCETAMPTMAVGYCTRCVYFLAPEAAR